MTVRCSIYGTLLSCGFLLMGCASSNIHKYTQAQITALTSREVEASIGETFRAAIDALFDGGYTIDESDREGGIITGFRKDDRSSERFWISPYIQDTDFRISVLVRERGARLTSTRVSMSKNGEPYIDEEAVDQFWRLMKRQVMIQAPPPPIN